MSDEEYDEELPPITVNTTTCEDVQFSMPSADVLASQRAHEVDCEEQLRQLRSQYEGLVSRVSPHDSSGSEGEAALAAAVDAMRVQPPSPRDTTAELLQKLISNLPDYDTTFLKDYLGVLQQGDPATIRSVTDSIMESIEEVLKLVVSGRRSFSEQELVQLGVWLAAAAVSARPRVPAARRALHSVLTYYTHNQTRAVCAAWAASAPAATLLSLSDAARAPQCCRSLAAPLLRAAFAQLLPAQPPPTQDWCAPLTADELACALAPGWRALPAAQRYIAAQLAGRVLAGGARGDSAVGPGARGDNPADTGAGGDNPAGTGAGGDGRASPNARLLALLATPPPAHCRHQPDYLKVMVAVSKLQVLFQEPRK